MATLRPAGLYDAVLAHHVRVLPAWPLGLPAWDDPQVALASVTDEEALVLLWNRAAEATDVELSLPLFAGGDIEVECVFPTTLRSWPMHLSSEGVLSVDLAAAGEAARLRRVRRS